VEHPSHYACISPCVGVMGFDRPRPPSLVGYWASSRRDRKSLAGMFTLTGRTRNDSLALITNESHFRIAKGKGGAITPSGYVDITDAGYVKIATFSHKQELIYKGQIYDWTDTKWKGSHICPKSLSCFLCCFATVIRVDTTQADQGILYVNNVTLYRKGIRPKDRLKKKIYDSAGENSMLIGDSLTYMTNSISEVPSQASTANSSLNLK